MEEILAEKSAQIDRLEALAATAVEEADWLRVQVEGNQAGGLAHKAGPNGASASAGAMNPTPNWPGPR